MGWGLRQSAENDDRPLLPPIQQVQKGRSPGVTGLVWAAGVLWLGYLLEVNRFLPFTEICWHPLIYLERFAL